MYSANQQQQEGRNKIKTERKSFLAHQGTMALQGFRQSIETISKRVDYRTDNEEVKANRITSDYMRNVPLGASLKLSISPPD
jgi:hypothetical protein